MCGLRQGCRPDDGPAGPSLVTACLFHVTHLICASESSDVRAPGVTHLAARHHDGYVNFAQDLIMSADCLVHTEYSTKEPPAHPGRSWTRFICIADTHSCTNFQVPLGDVLLHGGDISSWGTYKQIRKTIDWICTLPHELKM